MKLYCLVNWPVADIQGQVGRFKNNLKLSKSKSLKLLSCQKMVSFEQKLKKNWKKFFEKMLKLTKTKI